jgi:hypothetical protein
MATKSSNLRDQIRSLLHENPTSVEEDLEALSQCEAQIRNRCIVEHIAQKCGLALAGFRTNDALEMYYDIKQGRHDLGFISKGWEDPGFRIGDLVEVGWWDRDIVQANSHHIMRFCATNGIGLEIQEAPITISLQLDGVLYSEGFNRNTFLKTIESLNVCVEKIHTLIPEGRPGRNSSAGIICGSLTEFSSRSH